MHLLNVAVLFLVLPLVGVEFAVTAFVNPNAWRLEAEPQLKFLSHFASVLGKVMPFWYSGSLLLLGAETWAHRGTPDFRILLAATALWLLTSLASFVWLVPLNNRVAEGAAGWQQMSRTWDGRHRVRVATLAIGASLLTYVVVR